MLPGGGLGRAKRRSIRLCAASFMFAMLAAGIHCLLPRYIHASTWPFSYCLRQPNLLEELFIFLFDISYAGVAPVNSQSALAQLCMAYAAPVHHKEQCTEQCTHCCSSQTGTRYDVEFQCKNTYKTGSGMAGCQNPYFGGIAGCCFVEKGDVCLPCEKASAGEKDCWSVANTCARRWGPCTILR